MVSKIYRERSVCNIQHIAEESNPLRGMSYPEDSQRPAFLYHRIGIDERVTDLLKRLTIKEKFSLCAGRGLWSTRSIKRLRIKSLKMTDGPHGVGALGSYFKKCTYFPTAICRAATWNLKLSEMFGAALAEEVRSIGYNIVLAPGINIVRTPLCGRIF